MYYVNKIVGWVSSPLGVAFLGFGVGWTLRQVAAQRKHRARPDNAQNCNVGLQGWPRVARLAGAWIIAFSAVFLWVMSCGIATRFVGVGLEREWERGGTMHGSFDFVPDADMIVILGGGVGLHKKCRAPELYSGADRVWQGANLYKALATRLPELRVFCTGGGVESSSIPFLMDMGVPREAILFSEKPRNTEEEAKIIYDLLTQGKELQHAKPKILLVTSAWHMSRAKKLFDRAGFETIPAQTDFEMNCAAERTIALGDFFSVGRCAASQFLCC